MSNQAELDRLKRIASVNKAMTEASTEWSRKYLAKVLYILIRKPVMA